MREKLNLENVFFINWLKIITAIFGKLSAIFIKTEKKKKNEGMNPEETKWNSDFFLGKSVEDFNFSS